MKLDTSIRAARSTGAGEAARELEELGFDGIWSDETNHDPFLPLVLAAHETNTASIGTSIAVAFARNPMSLAYTCWDLQALSSGRFVLGLGSQIRSHITRRFSMPWSKPAARMREMLSALHAIWRSWSEDEPLDFQGEFYTHTLMTPFFSPGPNPFGPPRIYLAAVGELMTTVASELADGVLIHSFMTERYLREVTLPTIQTVLARSGRSREDFVISQPTTIVTAADEEGMRQATQAARERIAFYGSTPAYLPVLELHGWGELGVELNRLSKTDDPQRWQRMGELIEDDMLHTFAIVAEPSAVAAEFGRRYGDVLDRVTLSIPTGLGDEQFAQIMTDLAATTARPPV